MKFESLILERFGMFDGATLDFDSGDGLHVIYGANEAGKSTTLVAMSDLLFGIDERTSFNFRHDYGKLRIGGKIANSSGDRLEFKRRKTRTGSLVTLSQSETTLPDAALVPFLGAVDRDQFHFLFGLDQERLRNGGKQMLDPQGSFAHTLFAAGTGLDSVNIVLSQLGEELKRLGSLADRRSKGEIWSAIDRFTGATSAKKSDMIVPDHYHAAEKARDDAATNRLKVDEQLKDLRSRRNFLERGRRVAPTLAALRILRGELAQYDAIPDLPEDFAETWKKADDDARSTAEAVARNIAEIEKLSEELEAKPAVGPIVGFEEPINALCERLGKYLGDKEDVPKLARRIVDANDQIHEIIRMLRLDHDPARIEDILPSRIAFAKIRELIKNGAVIRSDLKTTETDHDDAKATLADAEAAIKDLPPDVDTSEPSELLAQAAKLGDVMSALVSARASADAADMALSEALGRLGLWSGTAEALVALPVPDTAAVNRSEERRVAARHAIDLLNKKIEETKREALQVEADLAGLAAVGEVPSSKAIRDARDERESQWRWIRTRFLRQDDIATVSSADIADSSLVGTFETSVRHADELVDRREAEAQRVAQLTAYTASQSKIAKTLVDLNAQYNAAEAEIERVGSEWNELWRDTGIIANSPVEMAKWLTRKDEALRLLTEARRAAENLREAEATVERARMLLDKAAQMLGLGPSSQELGDLERRLRHALAKLQAAASERSATLARGKTARERMQKTNIAFDRARAAEVKWQAAWREAVIEIHLAPTAGAAEAETALSAWEAITGPLTKRKEDQRRYTGLNEDLDHFRADAASLAVELSEHLEGADPIEKIVRDLKTRCDEAKAALQERANLENRLVALQAALDEANELHRAANFAIDAMRRTYGFTPDTDAYDLARRSSQCRRLQAQIEERVNELTKAGDALDEATLQVEVDSVPPDQANAELAAIQEDEALLIAKIQLLAKAETEAEHNLVALGEKKGAAVADQEARNAALAAGGHIERWLRLEIARRLLERSVRRYQDENQNPMIVRASELFARIVSTAANPIERISIDYRDAANPVPVGRRRDGSECSLRGLSEATRDQLFLSLRVAAIERFCVENEPLPFVADDLFMTSDERRSLPLLQILAELARTTQVIVFTHHQHIVDIARNMPEAGIRIHTMPEAA